MIFGAAERITSIERFNGAEVFQTEEMAVPGAIGVNVKAAYIILEDRMSIYLQTNVPMEVWKKAKEIQEAIRVFAKIEDLKKARVGWDQNTQVALWFFKEPSFYSKLTATIWR